MNTQVKFTVSDKPSSSKGWARYRASVGDTKLVRSRTGNEWVSATHEGDAETGARVTLTTQVMLRVGKGRTARQEIDTQEHALIVSPGSECEIYHRPGSQGLRLRIEGAVLTKEGASE